MSKVKHFRNIANDLVDICIYVSTSINKEIYLKSDNILDKLLDSSPKGTSNVDLNAYNIELYNVIKDKLHKICDKLLNEHIVTHYKIEDLPTESNTAILKLYKDEKCIVCINISLQNINNTLGICKYKFYNHKIQDFTIENILCDKILATLSQNEFKITKYFYDIYIILSNGLEFDTRNIFSLMVEKVGIDKVRELFNYYPYDEDTILKLMTAWNSLVIANFTKTSDANKPDFTDMMYHNSRLYKPLKSIVEEVK